MEDGRELKRLLHVIRKLLHATDFRGKGINFEEMLDAPRIAAVKRDHFLEDGIGKCHSAFPFLCFSATW